MPSPTTSSSTSTVGQATSLSINALIAGVKWGGVTGTGVTLAYSFPWTSSGSATFSGPNGIGSYSSLNEQNASFRYGLSTTEQAATRNALQSWANVANIVFSEVSDTSLNVGDIRFAWTSAPKLNSANVQAGGWAGYPDSYWPSGGDVWLSTLTSVATNPDWSAGSYNFNLLIHELGHALGLKHSFEVSPILSGGQDSMQYTVMSYTNHPQSLFVQVTHNANGSVSWRSFNVQPDTPMLYDVAAMQYMYGANLSYRTGNDVYTFDPNTPFFRTIWDAGGTDTISVSNFTKGCVIDLRQGYFSKITIESDSTAGYNWNSPPPRATYDGTDNLAIAYGSVIENAIGGAGNDTITGNDANNRLDGGGGNDILYGGAGNDTFDWDASLRGGNDVFYGGTGNDIYVLDSSNDTIIEYANEGTDTVYVPFSYSLGNLPYIENLRAFGSAGLTLTGNAANNILAGSSGNDTINGSAGIDTFVYSSTRASYITTKTLTGFNVSGGADGADTLTNIERLSFADGTLGLDTSGTSGQMYRLYKAAFDRVPDTPGLGHNIRLVDGGLTLAQMSSAFVVSAEFTNTYGALSNAQFINQLYLNVLDRAADAAGLAHNLNLLNTTLTRADMLAAYSESAENQVAVIGQIQDGIWFT